jgi:23S rRNA (uracil1939-C5)-methyltransferase
MAAGGDAIAREPSGRVVFVEGALPGERVVVSLVQQKRDFARGRVVSVLDASPDRVAPPCPFVEAGCGGCQWQHIAPEAQGRLKREIVVDALRRIGRRDDAAEVVAPSVAQAWGPRTTVRAAVSSGEAAGEGAADAGRAGLRRRHSHQVVPLSSCLVAHPLVAEVLAEGRFDGCDEVTVRAGVATGERLVVADPTADGVSVPADVMVVPVAAPFASVREDVAGRRWQVSALSFFQPGPEAAGALAEAVGRAAAGAGAGGVVLDAYAGVGLLGGSVGAERVVAVESSPWAVADAVVNLYDQNALVVEGEVADAVPGLGSRLGDVDLVIADPARTGLGRSAAAALASVGAPVLVLVSCDPASFARDAALLDGLGYRLAGADVLDLFPHTFHVEVLGRFERVVPLQA